MVKAAHPFPLGAAALEEYEAVSAEHARQLERELAEMSAANIECLKGWAADLDRLEQQLATQRPSIEAHPSATLTIGAEALEEAQKFIHARSKIADPWRSGNFIASELLRLAALSATLPSEPPYGLLVSIALRLDHGLFLPLINESEAEHKRRIEVALSNARKAWEECSGNGFYSPEREAGYAAMPETGGPSPLELFQIARPEQRNGE